MSKKKKQKKALVSSKREMSEAIKVLANGLNTTLDTLYVLNSSSKEITLSVKVGGKNQTGDMTIKLDEDIIAEELAGDFPETSLGTNKTLHGKKLTIVAVITDTSNEINFTSLTINLSGGLVNTEFPLSKEVDNDGDSAEYSCLIEFFKP